MEPRQPRLLCRRTARLHNCHTFLVPVGGAVRLAYFRKAAVAGFRPPTVMYTAFLTVPSCRLGVCARRCRREGCAGHSWPRSRVLAAAEAEDAGDDRPGNNAAERRRKRLQRTRERLVQQSASDVAPGTEPAEAVDGPSTSGTQLEGSTVSERRTAARSKAAQGGHRMDRNRDESAMGQLQPPAAVGSVLDSALTGDAWSGWRVTCCSSVPAAPQFEGAAARARAQACLFVT